MNIAIVVSSWHYFYDPFKLQPLHELYFATFINDRFNGVGVRVVDMRDIRKDHEQVNRESIEDFMPEEDLYIYWVMKAADYFEVLLTVETLRELYPRSKHVAGGTHIHHCFNDAEKYFDSIISGPGEEVFAEIITDMRNGRDIKSVYRTNWGDSIYDDYPIAHRGYLYDESIVNNALFLQYGEVPGTSVLLQRGCNFNCTYCVYNIPNMIQHRSPENIKKEINYLKSAYGVGGINLRDEIAIPVQPRIAIPFMEAIGSCDVIWRGQTRVGVKRNIIKLASETGCVELAVGVETADPQVLKLIDKKQTMSMVRDFIDYAHEFGIRVKMCLILGLPGEPENIVDITKKYIQDTNPDYIAVSGFCPVPGSVIYQKSEYYGIKSIDKDLTRHAHLMFRFNDDEEHGVPFEYEKENRWGKTFARNEIIQNVADVQKFCRDREMVY